MSFSPRQTWQLQEHVRLLWNELNQTVQQLEEIQRLYLKHGPEVIAMLEGLITPQEWQTVHQTVATYRHILQERLDIARGDELDPEPEIVKP